MLEPFKRINHDVTNRNSETDAQQAPTARDEEHATELKPKEGTDEPPDGGYGWMSVHFRALPLQRSNSDS